MTTVLKTTDNLNERQLIVFFGWLIVSFCPAATAVFVSTDGWYATLRTPSWNPPAWVFGPVWTVLYFLIAVAAFQVWRQGGWRQQSVPLSLFLVQLVLNAIWTPLFFGMNRLGLAFGDIVVLWLIVAATLVAFLRVKTSAGLLLVPYLAWVSLATALNYTIWRLNMPSDY